MIKNKELSYLKYWDVNDLYRWAMSQKLQVNIFEQIKDISQFNEGFIKKYDEENDEEYFLEVDIQYPKILHELRNDLPILPARMKVEKLLVNLHDKTECFIHIRNVKQALKNRLILKKVHGVIEFNQKPWLKPYFDVNTMLREKAKNNVEKDFIRLINKTVFEKTMEM